MNITDLATIKSLCTKYHIIPSKRLGQNFLMDDRVAQKMCEAANLSAEDFVVEVGPGLGALTQELAARAGKVLAVEVDRRMFAAAQEILALYKNVEVVQGDILKIANSELTLYHKMSDRTFCDRGYKVVASLPYSITSAVLRKFTEGDPPLRGGAPPLSGGRPSLIVVLVQKEVAERVCAKPGQMSVLSVAVQYHGRPEVVAIVPRSAFWPEPEVESAILRIITRKDTDSYGVTPDAEKRLFQIVRIGFSSRRKQLQNNLMAGLRLPRETVLKALKTAGLPPMVRAQELSVEQWIKLSPVLTDKA